MRFPFALSSHSVHTVLAFYLLLSAGLLKNKHHTLLYMSVFDKPLHDKKDR